MNENPAQIFLAELSRQIGIENLAYNEDSVCCLEVGDRLAVQIEWEPVSGFLVFLSRVGSSPSSGREEFFRALLEANFLFHGTAGETLCLDPESGDVMLCRTFPLATTAVATLLGEFTYFLETTDTWADRVENGLPGPTEESGPSPSTLQFRA